MRDRAESLSRDLIDLDRQRAARAAYVKGYMRAPETPLEIAAAAATAAELLAALEWE